MHHYDWPCAYEKFMFMFIDEEPPWGYLEVGHGDVGSVCEKMREGEPFGYVEDLSKTALTFVSSRASGGFCQY